MKISKSKRELAQLLIDAGVKAFPEGAQYVAQDCDDLKAYYYSGKPVRLGDCSFWDSGNHIMGSNPVKLASLVKSWHQTALSRAEFDHIVTESTEQSKPDADGWIEWHGGECPVDGDLDVSVKVCGEGGIGTGKAKSWSWRHCGDGADIVAYRLHNPEQVEPQYCESVTRAIPEPVTAPTLDQLLQDYRNASDLAATKQAEADEAAKMRDERWMAVQARAFDLRVRIIAGLAVDAEMRESELAITDWRDLRVGDVIRIDDTSQEGELPSGEYEITHTDMLDVYRPLRVVQRTDPCSVDAHWPALSNYSWCFIRRP